MLVHGQKRRSSRPSHLGNGVVCGDASPDPALPALLLPVVQGPEADSDGCRRLLGRWSRHLPSRFSQKTALLLLGPTTVSCLVITLLSPPLPLPRPLCPLRAALEESARCSLLSSVACRLSLAVTRRWLSRTSTDTPRSIETSRGFRKSHIGVCAHGSMLRGRPVVHFAQQAISRRHHVVGGR